MGGLNAEFWVTIGFCGQALYGLRFLIQWLTSERRKRSIIPSLFWHLSLPAAVMVLAYAVWLKDPVFVVSESLCIAIFMRNIVLERFSGVRKNR